MVTSIPDIADSLSISTEQLAADIYKVARYLEDTGNKGVSRHTLKSLELSTEFLLEPYSPAWEGILFFAVGSKRRDFDGWGVRRRPVNWTIAWGERYGWQTEIGQALIEEAETAARVEHEARRVKRHNDTFTQGRFEDYATEQIAYRMAASDILMRRYGRLYRARRHSADWQTDIYGYLMRVWMQQNLHMQKELEYRTKADPEARSSKKKTEAAHADFQQAQKFLDAGTSYFFSEEFVRQAIESEAEPDLRVDFDHLPKQPADKTPVRWLTDGQLVTQFMTFLTQAENDTTSFEYEDTRAILKTLRNMLARAKGQKISDEPEKIGSE